MKLRPDRVRAAGVSTGMPMGRAACDVTDDSVRMAAGVIIGEASEITGVVVGFGGLLGMGAARVSRGFET